LACAEKAPEAAVLDDPLDVDESDVRDDEGDNERSSREGRSGCRVDGDAVHMKYDDRGRRELVTAGAS
jgi:hypothetical protein